MSPTRGISVTIAAFYCALLIAVSPQRAPDFPPESLIEWTADQHRACVDETGVSEASIARFNGVEIFDDDVQLKCYMECMFRQFNVTKPDGDVDMIGVYHAIPKQLKTVALKVYNKCRDVVDGGTLCERAFSHHKCWKQTDPDHYYLF
ncbi:general odorant-binding protein 83a-like [Topomyia yanbarensis]|uniref:general odorant-binding protein 83a-like n=1 Tax=Topomyia yanbarensis TaxID=2498891 RepID=UPI00273B077F|nr:general odorant-binding protein 83a-like [Topomyia yanbarensis]